MKIKQLDKHILRLIETDMDIALKSVGEKYGVKIAYKGGSFTPTNATLRMEVSTISSSGEAISADVQTYKTLAGLYGLDPKMLNSKVTYNGSIYTITGLNPRRHRFPLTAIRQDGARFKLPIDSVKIAWERQQKPKVVKQAKVVTAPVVSTAPPVATIIITNTQTITEHNVASVADILGTPLVM